LVLRAPTTEAEDRPQQQVRRAALVTRVSTDRQAMTVEGSLKNRLQRLRQHIEYKRTACAEEWVEAKVCGLKAISGKDSLRSQEFQGLFADIRSGRVNTILCTALDRISRSVKDLLNFFEILNQHGVEFVCLKQNYDTTTPQGMLSRPPRPRPQRPPGMRPLRLGHAGPVWHWAPRHALLLLCLPETGLRAASRRRGG
jgi:hypothetical protein